jgi:hypothetical protein
MSRSNLIVTMDGGGIAVTPLELQQLCGALEHLSGASADLLRLREVAEVQLTTLVSSGRKEEDATMFNVLQKSVRKLGSTALGTIEAADALTGFIKSKLGGSAPPTDAGRR